MPWIYETKYLHAAANVEQVTTQPGALKALIVGIAVAGNLVAYDSASANENTICSINSNAVGCYEINARVSNGLRVVFPANASITVVYK